VATVLWLGSDTATFVIGHAMVIDGGPDDACHPPHDALLVLTGSTASANLQPSRFIRSRRAISRLLGESSAVSPILISPSRS
jgi:hypothetical protein